MVCRGANSTHQGHGEVEEVSKYLAAACAYQFFALTPPFAAAWRPLLCEIIWNSALLRRSVAHRVPSQLVCCVQRSSLHGTSTTRGPCVAAAFEPPPPIAVLCCASYSFVRLLEACAA